MSQKSEEQNPSPSCDDRDRYRVEIEGGVDNEDIVRRPDSGIDSGGGVITDLHDACDEMNKLRAENRSLQAENERLAEWASELDRQSRPLCYEIDAADSRAMGVDGPVGPTSEHMSTADIQACLSFIWDNWGDPAVQPSAN